MTVKVKDRGWKKLEQAMKKYAKGQVVAVGIQGSEAELSTPEHGSMTNAELGAIHEYGTKDGHVPERSYLRSTFDAKQAGYQKEVDKLAKNFFGGSSQIEGELLLLGEKNKADIIKKVKAGISPELAGGEAYLERRPGYGSVPLWATGQLMGSITAVVLKPGEKPK